jgi:putative oxidoreductase
MQEVASMSIALLILRIVVGGLLIGHGTQKLFGCWGGGGMKGTAQFFTSLRYPNGKLMAALAGATETGGGLLLAIGFLTPLAAAAIIGVMLNAIVAVHWNKGLWVTNGGFEYPLVVAATAFAVAWGGAGRYSIDGQLSRFQDHVGAGLTAFVIGASAALLVLSSRRPEREPARERPGEMRRAA